MKHFRQRRQTLAEKMANNSITIIPSASLQLRNRDTEYRFRQHSDFYYLTGLSEHDALLVLEKNADGDVKHIMLSQEKDKTEETWTGPRVGQDFMVKDYMFDEAYAIAEADEKIPELLKNKKQIYALLLDDPDFDNLVLEWLKESKATAREANVFAREVTDVAPWLHEQRLIKQPEEIECMAQVAEISAAAHKRLMEVCSPDLSEYNLAAEFYAHCMHEGCIEMAYPPIVASGHNACILHYVDNTQPLKDGDLVLVDAGAELDCYAADITRTYPVSGKFSPEQKAIYQLVLDAQIAGIACAKPGYRWNEVQTTILEHLVKGLVDLDILQGDVDQLIADKAYFPFYMHNSGHWLGLDVHDVGGYKVNDEWREFQPGMVLTVEPGLYISPDEESVDAKWRGIGVRIEDDILVTENGPQILTAGVPKEVAEIEALMNEA